MPFDIAKLKAEVRPSALKERAQNLNDRYTSPSSSSTGYIRPVRPVKPSTLSTASASSSASSSSRIQHAPPAPPARRVQEPQPYSSSARNQEQDGPQQQQHAEHNNSINWKAISQEDKNSLFSLLDGFFLRDRNTSVTAAARAPSRMKLPSSPVSTTQPGARDEVPPPPPALWARPGTQGGQQSSMSYPTPCRTSCHAEDVAQYFSPSERWTSSWFTADRPLPHALEGRSDMTWTSSWSSYGTAKTLVGTALFSDLSIAWWKVEWDDSQRSRPAFLTSVGRQARFSPCPAPFSAEELWYACSTYGEQVAAFAETAEQRGVPVGRGECWDVASQALAAVRDLPAPIPSLARTHGHLIFSGSASGKDYRTMQKGTWRGHDTAVRRGDIVEWRKVRVQKLDGMSWSDLGDPDHTAVIVGTYMADDPAANSQPTDGAAVSPWEIGTLEVIEQSQGKRPSRGEYNLAGMESGEIWIYRPVGMQDYIGIEKLLPDWEQSVSRGSVQHIR